MLAGQLAAGVGLFRTGAELTPATVFRRRFRRVLDSDRTSGRFSAVQPRSHGEAGAHRVQFTDLALYPGICHDCACKPRALERAQ